MQGSLTQQRMGSRVVGGVMAMIGAVTAVSIYAFYRVDRVQDNVQAVNQFYVPVLKHLNVLNGKWSAYQRSFEQTVSFRKWGASNVENPEPKIHLKKLVAANLEELSRRADGRWVPETPQLKSWIASLSDLVEREPVTMAEIESLLKNKQYAEAAAIYTQARAEHLKIGQGLAELSRNVENSLAFLQISTEQELRGSQSMIVLLLAASLLFSLLVLMRIRRWLLPLAEWTRVAQEIALKGITRDIKFPQIKSGMPGELSLLTREFTRMGTTVLERERTIFQQTQKLEQLNLHLKEQNLELRKLEHAKKLALAGNLSSQVAHEVRNPLNSMSLQLEMLEEDVSDDRVRGRVKAISEQVERLDRITRRYLDVGRAVSTRKETLNLHERIEKCVQFLSHEIQSARVLVTLKLEAKHFLVAADGDAIEQVIFNLVRNAIEAMRDQPPPRALEIATESGVDLVRMRVIDSGPGILADFKHRLFEPFVTNKAEGHGLGLSVSRQICIEHGGDLKLVETEAGATFEMSIPLVDRSRLKENQDHAPNPSC